MNNKINILSTKVLDNSQTKILTSDTFHVEQTDFIKIEPIEFDKDKLIKSSKNWVITSKNTLSILFDHFDDDFLKNINFYCVGSKTKQELQNRHYNIIESALTSKQLGELIAAKNKNKEYTLIGGVIKRHELPSLLRNRHINFTDITIYDTVFTPHFFSNNFDGILFFSPSAIQSYTIKNTIKQEQLFCIGNTTASEAIKHSNNIHIANQQTFESVLNNVKQYYI